MFPSHRFGTYVLDRQRLIAKIKQNIDDHKIKHANEPRCHSILLSGCEGTGKTSLLMLTAKSLKMSGYEVYYFSSVSLLSSEFVQHLIELTSKSSKLFAVLVDDITLDGERSDNYSNIQRIMKRKSNNLVFIGSTVVPESVLGINEKFSTSLGFLELALKTDDSDFLKLVEDLCGNKEEFLKNCKYILGMCNGHLYPTLAKIEYFFSSPENRQKYVSYEPFFMYFNTTFSDTWELQKIADRCFPNTSLFHQLENVWTCRGTEDDFKAIEKVGWWLPEERDCLSPFLKNLVLRNVRDMHHGLKR
jgi:hypothetical protein